MFNEIFFINYNFTCIQLVSIVILRLSKIYVYESNIEVSSLWMYDSLELFMRHLNSTITVKLHCDVNDFNESSAKFDEYNG